MERMFEKERIAIRLLNRGYSIEETAYFVDASINLVRQWIQHNESVAIGAAAQDDE